MEGQEEIPGLDPVFGLGEVLDQIPAHYDDVGPGWRKLLEGAHQAAFAMDPGYTVAQVKEKFGGLRIYLDSRVHRLGLDGPVLPVWEAVEPFEAESYTVCEWCGEPGQLDRDWRWVLTLCPACKAERDGTEKARREERIQQALEYAVRRADENLDED